MVEPARKIRYDRMQIKRLKSQLANAATNLKDIKCLSRLQALLDEFRTCKQSFDTNVEDYIIGLDDNDPNYEKATVGLMKEATDASETLAIYEAEIKSAHRALEGQANLDSLVPPELNQSFRVGASTMQPKVKKIEIPTFDGNILNFNNFRGLYENLIHNNAELSNVQKLYHLKQSMVGNASEIIRDFELSDSAYAQAWSMILGRYDNKRAVVKTLFKKLISIESIKSDVDIRPLLDQFEIIVRALQSNGESVDGTFSKFVTFLLLSRLDFRTAKDFENSLGTTPTFPQYDQLQKFLTNRAFTAEDFAGRHVNKKESYSKTLSAETKPSSASTSLVSSSKSKEKRSFTTTVSKSLKCVVCSQSHYLNQCDLFLNKTSEDRFDVVKRNKLCIRCFNPFHRVADCNRPKCDVCDGNHHKLLHRDERKTENSQPSNSSSTGPSKNQVSLSVVSTDNLNNKIILLPTGVANARVMTKVGERSKPVRIMFDHGSQVTLISEEFVNNSRVNVRKSPISSKIGGITGDSISTEYFVNLALVSRHNTFKLEIQAEIVREIPYSVEMSLILDTINANSNLKFAETKTATDRVDIVIGAEYYEKCIRNRKENFGTMFLRDTEFGWVLSGPHVISKPIPNPFCGVTVLHVQDQLRKFWEIEEVNCLPVSDSEHDLCEKHFLSTYQRNEKGRFVVRLPFKDEKTVIGETRNRAVACLKRVELKYDSDTFSKYVEFLREYEDLGHMSPAQRSNSSSPTYYIPHRAVLRPSSTTTQLRVVFNASSKSKSNFSLNDILMTGPAIQPQLYDILLRFRLHNVAFSADIGKMYRQIFVHDLDRDMQRIVWRESPNNPILDYKLNTVTYGTAPASYIATKCLSVLGNEIANSKPIVARTIQNDFCMDDLLTGAASVEEASALQLDIDSQLRSAGFELRKYMSNSVSFLDTIDPALVEKSKTIEFRDLQTVSLLGMEWHPVEDSFSIKLNLHPPDFFKSLSRRQILSEISRIFDPLGFLSPVVIKAKMILQEVCKAGLAWDEKVSPALEKDFLHYYSDLTNLKSFVVRRPVSRFDSAEIQLIGFCDASDKAYCAVVYLRSVDPFGNVECYIVTSKTRIAPKNEFKLTIPKLELQAALLLAELLCRVARELSIENNSLLAFSDSTVVLHWLNGSIERWSVFVQNRVRKIEKLIPKSRWNYVNTKSNPADLGTRGLNASNFLQHSSFWLYGPSFVLESIENRSSFPFLESSEIPETRSKISLLATNDCNKFRNLDLSIIVERYSSFTKIVKIVYFVIRFISLCKRENFKTICNTSTIANSNDCSLEVQNRNMALNHLIQSEQMAHYRKEIILLKENKRLPKTSSLCSLSPFIDENGILRASSRLNNSNLSYENRNRIIMYAKRKLIEKLVSHVHITYFHATRNFICNFLSAKYVILGGLTNIVKKVIRNCVTCIRYRGISARQLMGQLPASRVTVSRPFENVGVDFAGSFSCKCVSHRSIKYFKIYAAFFVCFVTRAVHIELVSSLSAESFIASLQRFVSRRGIPSNIYSDNATNFVGASNILNLNSPSVQRFAAEKTISWHFIAPRAPNHGGIWEAAVKSAKYHLVRVTNGQTLNFEEYETIFAQIEAILNSRPLCYRRNSQSSLELLTPGHFLIGSSLLSLSIPDSNINSTLRLSKRFELLRGQIQSFWTTWSKDYLNQIRSRPKWNTLETNLKPGDVVLVKEDNLRPADWSLGVVEETYPDPEGVVRVVLVRLKNSLKKRAINSLVPILSDEDPNPHPPQSMLE